MSLNSYPGIDPSVSPERAEESSATCTCLGIVSVFDFIPVGEQAAILSGNSTYDCTADIHAARDAVNGSGKVLLFPGGTYYVSEVVFSGENYTIATSGTSFQQKPGLTGDGAPHPIIAFTAESQNIRLGDLNVRGNIATDLGESSHGIMVASAKSITIGNIFGEDLRGDVLYTYGRTTSEAEVQRDLVTGIVRGKNVYRCIVALAGGDATIAGIVQEGAVGYRDLDVEPNTGGAYQPVRVDIGFLRGSVVQITSADPQIINESVRIEHLDLDGTRIANSSVPYPNHGGVNSYALSINNIDTVAIGKLKLRNYASYPVYLAALPGYPSLWREIRIGTLDFENCSTEDTTYKTIIRQATAAPDGARLLIDRLVGKLSTHNPLSTSSPVTRMVLLSETSVLPVAIGSVNVIGGTFGVRLTGTIGAGQFDCAAGGNEIFLNSCDKLTVTGLSVVNAANTHGFHACRCITLIGCSANFGASLDYASASTAIVGINSAINGALVPSLNVLAP
ncbi:MULTISPECIES: hypothetical protein [unclassified Sphingomonas]|jgi:hypothetical protein|nr:MULTISPECIES: hypothetical protein [unclassified Sphingomonas]